MRFDNHGIQFLFLNIGHLLDHLFMLIFATAVIAVSLDPAFQDTMALREVLAAAGFRESAADDAYGVLILLSTASFIAFGAGSLPSGWLGDKFGRRTLMAVFFLGIGSASIATAFSAGPVSLALGLLAIGVFASIYHPVGLPMVAENARELGKEVGVNGVFGNVGVALAAITTGFLVDQFGWRSAFLLPGVISVAVGIAYVIFCNRPIEARERASKDKTVGASKSDVRRVLLIVALGSMCGTLIFNTMTISLPKVFDVRLGGELAASTSSVGLWSFAVFMVAAVAQILIGHLLDRYPLKPIYVLTVGLQIPVIFLLVEAAGSGMLGGAAAMMFLVFGVIPIHDTIVARYTTPEWRGRVYAVKYLLSLTVAATAVPLIGALYDRTGDFATMFIVLGSLATVLTLCALCMPGARKREAAQPAE